MDFVRPLLCSDGVTMQRIDHWIPAIFVLGVAWRKKDDSVAIDGVAFKIAFECGAVNLDMLNRHWLGAGNNIRHDRLDLPEAQACAGNGQRDESSRGARKSQF